MYILLYLLKTIVLILSLHPAPISFIALYFLSPPRPSIQNLFNNKVRLGVSFELLALGSLVGFGVAVGGS